MKPGNSSRPSRWALRLLAALSTATLLLTIRVPAALAAPIVADDPVGQTPPALSWIQLKDTRGIPMWNFEMSLDRGGITSPDKFFWASITDAAWGAYRSWCALALWFLDWVLSFTWVSTLAAPLLAVGDAMQGLVNRVGLVPTFLTVTALLAGLWFLKGKFTTAVWEVGIACVIAALASGVFAHPVQMVAGPDGYIVKANQTGQQLAAELATGDAAGKSPDQLRQAQTGQLVDTFIRQPTEMINFGRVIDGGKCESTYNDVIKKGPYGSGSDIRDAVNGCDPALGEYAASPSSSMAIGAMVFMPASFVILLMGLIFGGSVIAAAVWAMFQSIKAIVTLVTGLLPGGGRGSLMLTVAETVVALLLIVFTSVFLSVFLLLIQAMFAGSSGDAVAKTFVIVDVLIVVALFVYWRQRGQIKALSQRMGQFMARRPGGASATRLPDRSPIINAGGATRAAAVGIGLMHARARMVDARKPPPVTNYDMRQQAAFFSAGSSAAPTAGPGRFMRADPVRGQGPQGPAARGQLPAGPDSPPALPPGPSGGPPPSGGSDLGRIERRKNKPLRTLVRAGTSAALAYATGGASTAVTAASRATKAAHTARRIALSARLAAASTSAVAKAAAGPSAPTGGTGRPGPAAPLPMRTKPSPRPGHTKPQPQVIVGEVIKQSSRQTSARPTPAADTSSRTPERPTGRLAGPTPRPQPAAPEGENSAAAELRARLADRRRGARRSA